eukprot:11232737-Alexandrium_andersonii.AAC.3
MPARTLAQVRRRALRVAAAGAPPHTSTDAQHGAPDGRGSHAHPRVGGRVRLGNADVGRCLRDAGRPAQAR